MRVVKIVSMCDFFLANLRDLQNEALYCSFLIFWDLAFSPTSELTVDLWVKQAVERNLDQDQVMRVGLTV